MNKLESPENGGGRAAIVLSGSPLFNGGAGSGELEIRRYLLENDLIEAIVALPTEIFFRTGIARIYGFYRIKSQSIAAIKCS